MGAKVSMASLALLVGLAMPLAAKEPSASEGSEGVRRASVLRAKAGALREQANDLRDGEGVKQANASKAKQLESQADSLESQANRIDAQDWPPTD